MATLAPTGAACESCRQAIASARVHLAHGMNTSILFMLAMVFIGVPSGFAAALWWSYRSARASAERGQDFRPEGKLRWSGTQSDRSTRG